MAWFGAACLEPAPQGGIGGVGGLDTPQGTRLRCVQPVEHVRPPGEGELRLRGLPRGPGTVESDKRGQWTTSSRDALYCCNAAISTSTIASASVAKGPTGGRDLRRADEELQWLARDLCDHLQRPEPRRKPTGLVVDQ